MSANDSVNGRITMHAGTRYGGKAQKRDDYRGTPDDDTLVERAKKFIPQKNSSADVGEEEKKRKSTRKDIVHIENIQWINKKNEKWMLVNSACLARTVKKLTTSRISPFNQLYKVFLRNINSSRITPVSRFCVIATGVDPQRKKKTWTFIKAIINDVEFVLPNSFLKDCSGAFLKKNSI